MHHYDVLPYESNPFSETHPRFLSVLGRLFGLQPADANRCRVLELGCAGGGNLIPMAWRLPGSEFVGIDLEARQIQDGVALVRELGLGNIRLEQGNILELGDELGRFDYIIAHGVYSWIPPPVREALMALCKRLLRPQGVAYISYNTRPGWHVRGMVREILLYHTRGVRDPLACLERAREMLELLGTALAAKQTPLAQHLLQEINDLKTADPSYLYHEYLEANNDPVLVSDFLALAKQHGLKYLCETRLYGMFAASLGSGVEAFLGKFDDQAIQEQYLDFFTQRTFRQTLLCHDEAKPDYDIDLAFLDRHACYANLEPTAKPDLRRDKAQEFLTSHGKPVTATDPVMKAMLVVLHEAYPAAVAVPELLTRARERVRAASGKSAELAENQRWRGELFSLFANNLIGLSPEPQEHSAAIPDRPRAHVLAQAQLRRGSRNITTVWHESLNTDAFSRRLLSYLDGTRDRQALVGQLLRDVAEGALSLPGLPENPRQRAEDMVFNVDRMLTLFARNGILEAAE